ncbi:hypothetical protein [Burkholderia territorii]|uniref:hypothetical protein n=1 Tax=Burkholderia territorii TaxID=1503055 RepID=UPI0007546A01|nr:hypothetical protein [Burkholderia territorii]KUZ35288.1 hypothetical protein WS52_04820 [Burkholderia territorii]
MSGTGSGLFIEKINHPCWTCEHWSGVAFCGGAHAICMHPGNVNGVVTRPRLGCAFWKRAIGLDDLDDEACDRLAHRFARPTRYTVTSK